MDDLGRVVIPKEIRRTLRIREGDPLEIFTDTDGMVVFKKYSPIGELADFAGQYAEVLQKTSDRPALICDCDHVIAAAGVPRKEYLGRRITPEMEEYLQSRARFVTDGQHRLLPVEGIDRLAKVVYPIVASSDVSGAVVLLQGSETETDIGETETKLTQAAAAFLGKQLEL
jgi:AbrB family transcriptional regulator (stage V sporulation protein T)